MKRKPNKSGKQPNWNAIVTEMDKQVRLAYETKLQYQDQLIENCKKVAQGMELIIKEQEEIIEDLKQRFPQVRTYLDSSNSPTP
jgi:hypothetical protein